MAPMPSGRRYVRTAVLDCKLYAAGGVNEADEATSNLLERYDLAAWEVVAPIATPRDNHGMAVLDGKLYAVAATTTITAGSARSSGTTRLPMRGRRWRRWRRRDALLSQS